MYSSLYESLLDLTESDECRMTLDKDVVNLAFNYYLWSAKSTENQFVFWARCLISYYTDTNKLKLNQEEVYAQFIWYLSVIKNHIQTSRYSISNEEWLCLLRSEGANFTFGDVTENIKVLNELFPQFSQA